jgi:hypothetical protein
MLTILAGVIAFSPPVASAAVIDSYTFDSDAQGMGAPQFLNCPFAVRPTLSGPFDPSDGDPAGSAGIGTTTLASTQNTCQIASYGTRRTPIDPTRRLSYRWEEKQTVSGLSPLGGNTIGGTIGIESFDANGNPLERRYSGILLVNRSAPWTAKSTSDGPGALGSDARTIRLIILVRLRFDSPLTLLTNARYAIDNLVLSQ